MPLSVLRRMMAGDDDAEEDKEDVEAEAEADEQAEEAEEAEEDSNQLLSQPEKASASESAVKIVDLDDALHEEEKKEEEPKKNADMEDWNMDDMSWGEDDVDADKKKDPEPAAE